MLLCDCRIPVNWKGRNSYETNNTLWIRVLEIKKHVQEMSTTEMRMLSRQVKIIKRLYMK